MSQRRRFNVSEYISTLNAVDEPDPSSTPSSSSNPQTDDLAAFSNTNFFDFDLGCSTDLATTVDQLFLEQEQLINNSKDYNSELVKLDLFETGNYIDNFITANHHDLGSTWRDSKNKYDSSSSSGSNNTHFHHHDSDVQAESMPAQDPRNPRTQMVTKTSQTHQSYTWSIPRQSVSSTNSTPSSKKAHSGASQIKDGAASSPSQPPHQTSLIPNHNQEQPQTQQKNQENISYSPSLSYKAKATLTLNDNLPKERGTETETGPTTWSDTRAETEDTPRQPEQARSRSQDQNLTTLEEEKRRRNTAASARFRIRKRLKQEQMEKQAKELRLKADTLELKTRQLELENIWLKSLVMNKQLPPNERREN
ncbi:hypothetical protein NADFUDRAFT_50962 [Nadsonia fulvescens var. elongata DSM 6958]|uniref:BZIP domain-containing protein n=1 Tax=Nadsonia fulvescens var. elongata DSM 6958 TaxID=857566 RepID=A0A1E3PK10_9ASCO|nr:hypothetical protein NADFUDRAFT_50962 [Nadsonia fulvescens var. elongata DSM 6958]